MTLEAWSILRNRDFALVCGARFAVVLALQITTVAIGWHIYDVTASAFALGYLGLAGLVPALALVLVTGYAADTVDRRLIMLGSDLALTLTSLALLLLVAAGGTVVWPIYIIAAVAAAGRAFHNPASQAIVPTLVGAGQLPSAIAFASGALQSAQIVGPALGGLLYAIDPMLPFAAAAALNGGAALACFVVRARPAAEPSVPRALPSYAMLMAGVEFARARPVVIGAMALDAAVVLVGGVVLLLPIFAKDILNVGPEGLGLLRAAPAVGAVLMAAWLSQSNYVRRNTGTKLFRTVALYGAATACFGLSHSFWLSLACLVVVGAADMVSVVIRHTMVQAETPDGLRGRVAAVNSLFTSSSSELSQVRAGVLAGLVGAVPAAVLGGLAAIALSVLWPRFFPDLARRDHLVESEGAKA